MSPCWENLPLLPLRCILDHLSMEDALAAMTTCRHWRSALLLYEGRKDTLKLRVKHLEKNMFLTRIFKKYTRKLHIYIDCNLMEFEKFMNFILPQYFDTLKLNEILFIGPSYIQQSQHIPNFKLKRMITESLIFKHSHCIQKLALMGCEMGAVKHDNDRFNHKLVEYYSRTLSFNTTPSAADTLLSKCNANFMVFSTLQHIVTDYECINTASLETLSNLTMFSHLTLNVTNSCNLNREPIDWRRLTACYPNRLDVSINIIALPSRKFHKVIENILVEELALVSLKVLFCKTLYARLIRHIIHLYKTTLRELVWVDAPYESNDPYHRIVKTTRPTEFGTCNVNPFIQLCWQCVHLRRLVIHGYWVWQYDLLGFVRLRKTLSQLEVSAIYNQQERFCNSAVADGAVRVFLGDSPATIDRDFEHKMNEYTEFDWKAMQWTKLHPALRARSTAEQRRDYVVQEAQQTLGLALY